MKSIDKLFVMINDHTPCILIKTTEEKQVEEEIKSYINELRETDENHEFIKNILSWTTGVGVKKSLIHQEDLTCTYFTEGDFDESIAYRLDPAKALELVLINKHDVPNIPHDFMYLFKDMTNLFPQSARLIRLIRDIKEGETNKDYVPLIFISTSSDVPCELKHLFATIDWDIPDDEEIEDVLRNLNETAVDNELEPVIAESDIPLAVNVLSGMTRRQYQYGISSAYTASGGKIDIDYLLEYKINEVKETEVLTYSRPDVNLDSIGGHQILKDWLQEQVLALSPEAREFGVDKPKGTMLLGVAGTGKTAMASALAGMAHIPLITMNLNNILGSRVGESEQNISKALSLVKLCAPCVLLIDECEKQLVGIQSSGMCDSGVIARVFQEVLSFLNDNDSGVYVVMTANDVSQLPPELTRSGRLDAQWFFDFPSEEERKDIFNIHLGKRNKELDPALIKYAAEHTDKFTGAEIQQVVKNMVRIAYIRQLKDGNKEIMPDDVKAAIEEVIPVSETSAEKVTALRAYCRGRARNTNKQIEKVRRAKSGILDFSFES